MSATQLMQPPYLTDAEILAMCEPLKQPAALCRFLSGMGLLVKQKPNGRPLVLRTELDRVMGASRFTTSTTASSHTASSHTAPNVRALRDHMSMNRKGQHGARA